MENLSACPECGAPVPVDPGYVTWCSECGWNLKPHRPDQRRGRLDGIYLRLGDRLSGRLLEEVERSASLRPRLTWEIGLATALALAVDIVAVLLLVLGVLLPVLNPTNLTLLFLGPLMFLLALFARPRVDRVPKDLISRREYPAVCRVVDRVTAALRAPKVQGIKITPEFNASFGRYGWRRRRIMCLGLPFLSVLDTQEKIAVIAHEAAHAVNGDPSRHFVPEQALNTLAAWSFALWHAAPDRAYENLEDLVILPIYFVLRTLARLSAGVHRVLVVLLYRDSQRAEYLADYLGCEVAGKAATLSTLEKVHCRDELDFVARRLALAPDARGRDLFAEMRERMAAMPEREIERIRRISRMEGSTLDAMHPPTAYRVRFLQARGAETPSVSAEAAEAEALEAELSRLKPAIQRELLGMVQAGLYYA